MPELQAELDHVGSSTRCGRVTSRAPWPASDLAEEHDVTARSDRVRRAPSLRAGIDRPGAGTLRRGRPVAAASGSVRTRPPRAWARSWPGAARARSTCSRTLDLESELDAPVRAHRGGAPAPPGRQPRLRAAGRPSSAPRPEAAREVAVRRRYGSEPATGSGAASAGVLPPCACVAGPLLEEAVSLGGADRTSSRPGQGADVVRRRAAARGDGRGGARRSLYRAADLARRARHGSTAGTRLRERWCGGWPASPSPGERPGLADRRPAPGGGPGRGRADEPGDRRAALRHHQDGGDTSERGVSEAGIRGRDELAAVLGDARHPAESAPDVERRRYPLDGLPAEVDSGNRERHHRIRVVNGGDPMAEPERAPTSAMRPVASGLCPWTALTCASGWSTDRRSSWWTIRQRRGHLIRQTPAGRSTQTLRVCSAPYYGRPMPGPGRRERPRLAVNPLLPDARAPPRSEFA